MTPQYEARREGDIVRLEDRKIGMAVSIMPTAGNLTSAFTLKGQSILGQKGIPFLAPWANRLDEQAFYANGRKYRFDMSLGNVRGDTPIHGFLSDTDQWETIDAAADTESAWATSRLEFWKQPAWMRQFPFAHTIEMTHRLQDGTLQVRTSILNLSTDPMPIAIGFHPYFQLTDQPRGDWSIAVPAHTRWLLSGAKIPTGDTEPATKLFPGGHGTLKDYDLDDVFSDLERDAQGRAHVVVKGLQQQIDVTLGETFKALVIYSPASSGFVCFEPMAGITDAMNLSQRGLYREQQYVAPTTTWEGSFWITPRGF